MAETCSRILFRGKDRDVVLGEVNAGFEQGDQLHQFLL